MIYLLDTNILIYLSKNRPPKVAERIDALSDDEQKRALGTDATGLYYPAVLHLKQQTIRLSSKSANQA